MKAEVKDRVLSHDRSVTSVIFQLAAQPAAYRLSRFQPVLLADRHGPTLRQTPNAHGDAEITTLANDPAESRFYSGGTDGIIWDCRTGTCYHAARCNRPELNPANGESSTSIETTSSRLRTALRTTSSRPATTANDRRMEHQLGVCAHQEDAPALFDNGRQASSFGWASGERRRSARSDRQQQQDMDSGFTISRLRVLANRKAKAKQAANLVSCGANGIVRFWNLHQGCLVASFWRISRSDYLATADGNGCLKVWHIAEYCTGRQDQSVQRGGRRGRWVDN
uniref:WD_REPEATS_REGION domain-containing protein n=1 Tax=Macrostomum lignano TaxID=282301 RepID=A0A1I8FE57_9PLAT